jgi:hypothetical protein
MNVRTAQMGRVRTCQIESKAFADAERWLMDRRSKWEKNYHRLSKLLDEEDDLVRCDCLDGRITL